MMPDNPVLSPTHADSDVLILDGVRSGVYEHARYGLSTPRRDLLALTLTTLLRSMRDGWEADSAQTLRSLSQTAGPSHPQGRDGGDAHVSNPATTSFLPVVS